MVRLRFKLMAISVFVVALLLFFLCFSFMSIRSPWSANDGGPAGRTRVIFWHAMAGQLGKEVKKMVNGFNQSQNKYWVIGRYKGDYDTVLMQSATAFKSKRPPDLVQAAEMSTAIMLSDGRAIEPLSVLDKNTGSHLNRLSLFPAVKKYYSYKDHLAAFPFNVSTAVMFYNKKALLDIHETVKDLATWQGVGKAAGLFLKKGYACGFTTTWPAWIQMEEFSAWHNIPFAKPNNGFTDVLPHLTVDNPILIKHLQQLLRWSKSKRFVYAGRQDAGLSFFTSNRCPMVMESSGSLSDLQHLAHFPVGVAMLPYEAGMKGLPQNTILGGAALWVFQGLSLAKQKAIAAFLNYLAEPKRQAAWARETGYLPSTSSAYRYLQASGFYKTHPNARIGVESLNYRPASRYSRGIRLGNYPLVRMRFNTMLESIFSGKESLQKALRAASRDGDALIKRFYQYNRRDGATS